MKSIFFLNIFLLIVLSCSDRNISPLDKAERLKPFAKKNDELKLVLVDKIDSFFKNDKRMEISAKAAVVEKYDIYIG